MRTTTIALLSAGLMDCVTAAPPHPDGHTTLSVPAFSASMPASPAVSSPPDVPGADAALDASPQTADASAPTTIMGPDITGPVGPSSPANAAHFHAALVDELAHSYVGPNHFHFVVTGGGARKLVLDSRDLTVIPILATFEEAIRGHCWVAVFLGDAPHPGLVSVPVAEDDDSCSGMRRLAEADLNHDGMPDFVYQLTLRSRRYHVDGPAAAVYLSDRRRATYCYAQGASESIMTRAAFTADGAVRAVENQVHRLGESVLRCAPP